MSLLRSLRKPIILVFLVILPAILPEIYERHLGKLLFGSAGTWLEDYHSFMFIAVASSVWLGKIAEKEKNSSWTLLAGIMTILLVLYWLMDFTVSRVSLI